MSILRLKTILFVSGSLLFYMAAGLVLFSIFCPIPVETVSLSARPWTPARLSGKGEPLPPLSAFSAVWDTPLQSPVFDVIPPPPEEKKVEMPPVNAKFLATIAEGGGLTVMLKLPSGSTKILKSGDTFENLPGTVRILEVRPKSVLVTVEGYEDTTITLELGK